MMIDFNEFSWFNIEPIDAWFFRDGRPHNRGEDQSELVSLFPPNAATIVGAIRAALARSNGWNGKASWQDDLKITLGHGFDDLGSLSFLGPFVARENNILWPMPAFVLGRLASLNAKTHRTTRGFLPSAFLSPSEDKVISDLGNIYMPRVMFPASRPGSRDEQNTDDQDGKAPAPATDAFLDNAGLLKVIHGQLPEPENCYLPEDLFCIEPRVGIMRDSKTRTTGQNALYNPRYVRLRKGVSLMVGVRGIPQNWKIPRIISLGGESRMAALSASNKPLLPKPLPSEKKHKTLVALSPTLFDHPWWGAGPSEPARKLFPHLNGNVVTLTLDRPRRIGGWNSLISTPLSLMPFVRPGTTWWISLDNPATSGFLQLGHKTSYGYGLSLLFDSLSAP